MGKAHETVRMKVCEVVKRSLSEAIDKLLKQTREDLVKWKLLELKSLVNSLEVYDVIIRQEIPAGGGFIDVDVLGRIIFELKSTIKEFKEAEEKIEKKYLPSHKKAKWAIITNYDIWNIYEVKNGKLEFHDTATKDNATSKLYPIFISELTEDFRLTPTPFTIATIFEKIDAYEDGLLEIFKAWKSDLSVLPLFNTYKTIVTTLYGKADDSFYERLFIKHTLLQMIVSSCLSSALLKSCDPVEACSGVKIPIEISLPYLNWWYTILSKFGSEEREFLEELCKDIYTKSQLIDWGVGSVEDAFRELYELLIDPETRRRLGEYYTPLWLVELLLDRVKIYTGSLKDKLIVDPFCGSGTFLVRAFHMKVSEGQNPEDAIKEVIGFDINPLAVSIARAELMLAYKMYRDDIATPLVFHTDTLAAMCEIAPLELYDIYEMRKIRELVGDVVNEIVFNNNKLALKDLAELLRIEMMLRDILETYLCSSSVNFNRLLTEEKAKYSWSYLGEIFVRSLEESSNEWDTLIAGLVGKYGNGVWSVAISSILAPLVISKMKADVIVTNPPWQQLTKISETYKDKMSKIASNWFKSIRIPQDKVGNVLQGSDLATIALWGGLRWSRGVIGYVMPRESSFCAKFRQRAGLILTYAVLRYFNIENGEFIDIDYDAFQHGNYPTLVVLKRG